ncbi:hypothetical protein I6E29_00890 [Arcanobacterium haemolyticum]|nr:hypothetical protein [Arcanobacterium haemolyticum]
MSWFKVDDDLWSHPKWRGLSAAAQALWVTAGSYSAKYETDGVITSNELRLFLPLNSSIRSQNTAISELVSTGLWEEFEEWFRFHDWDVYQPTKAQKDAERAATRERVKRFRNGERNGVTPGVSNGAPVPDPVPNKDTTEPNGSVVKKKPETRLPADWHPTDAHIKRAHELGLDIQTQVDLFKAHAAEHDRRARNWSAAFTRWLMNAAEYRDRDAQRYQQRQAAANLTRGQRAAVADLERYLAREQAQPRLELSS